ncbi:MAG TPA: beta-ketoacyl-ACP synthase II [Candidatus Caccousia avistercoris]|nr:beta-ketoacyl-ACP synthase II [Candidatus Caccousia avistercoris]
MRRVVVTGMGAVTPVGNHLEEYWNSISQGICGIGPITRFDASDKKVQIAAEVKGFDPTEYMEKSELRKNDLFVQYAVAAAEQAMQDSGLAGTVAPERLGVYVGSGIGGILTTTENSDKLCQGAKRVSPFMVPMMIVNMASGTISIRTQAKGPTLPVVTACATSTHAIGEAFRAVKHGYADAILAGGSEAAVCNLTLAGFTSCMALSTNNDPATACRPFDKNRDGFVMGEGAGILVLEEYEHAKARGAKIYGEICGYGNTSDAYHVTAPDPEAEGITRAIQLALEEAGVSPDASMYVNAHGTSTPLNDKSETLAFKKAFGEAARQVAISSTKSMTGHMLGAAGAVEAIACLKALETGIIPPTIGLQEPDPECDLDYTPGKARKAQLRTALSTSLGFGGHNGCLVFRKIEEA